MSFRVTITLSDDEGKALVDKALEATAAERVMVPYTTLAGRYVRAGIANVAPWALATPPETRVNPAEGETMASYRKRNGIPSEHTGAASRTVWKDGHWHDTEATIIPYTAREHEEDMASVARASSDAAHILAPGHGEDALAAAQRTLRANRIAAGLNPDTGKPLPLDSAPLVSATDAPRPAAFVASHVASGDNDPGPDSERRRSAIHAIAHKIVSKS